MSKTFFILLSGLCFFDSVAQRNRIKSNSKTDISFHCGPAFFQGDVSSGIILSDKRVSDIKLSNSNFNMGIGLNHRFSRLMNAKSNLNLLQLCGDDNWGKNAVRGTKFRTFLAEMSLLVEYSLLHWDYTYNQNYRHHIFIASGIAIFYYSPMGQYDNKWVGLRELGTEGQGLKPGLKKYSVISYSVPMNIGYRYMLNKKEMWGFEFCFRKAFTDYIDDVSGTYYDNGAIAEKNGKAAAYFADPNLIKNPNGHRRGNYRKGDNYSFANLTYSRFIGARYSKKSKWINRMPLKM